MQCRAVARAWMANCDNRIPHGGNDGAARVALCRPHRMGRMRMLCTSHEMRSHEFLFAHSASAIYSD